PTEKIAELDLGTYLPDDIAQKVNLDTLESVFGSTDPIIIFFETDDVLKNITLQRIESLTHALQQSEQFKDVVSLYTTKNIRSSEGTMIVDPVIKQIPETDAERQALRKEIIDNPLAYKLVVSEDFRYSLIMFNPQKGFSDNELFKTLNKLLSDYPGPEKVYFNGMPYLRDEIQKKAIHDLALLMPLGILIMIGFLYFSFREIKGVLVPLSVVVMSIILAMGLMPLLGYELSIIAVLVPILMIAIANNYGVHIVTRYQELNARYRNRSMKTMLNEALYYLRSPILLTALTTIVGILGMVTHIMLPAKQMGIVSAVGITFALLLSLYYVPAVMSYLKKGKPQKSFLLPKHTLVDKFLAWAGKVTTGAPKKVVATFIAFLLLTGAGIYRLQVSFNNEKIMPASHPLRIATGIANRHLGGTKVISLLFEGDIKDPALLNEMERFSAELKKLPQVGSATSIATVIKTISRAMNDPGDSLYDRIPDTRDAVAQYIEFYNLSGDPADFERLVDFDYTKANLNVQFKAEDIKEFNKVENAIDSLMATSKFCKLKAGHCLVEKQMARSLVKGQNYSLIFAFAAIILLLWWIFRSLKAGIMGSIPLVFSVVCTFGLMGWLGFELDIATSLLSSVAIGIGVDYTIHLFWRLKTELSDGVEYAEAVRKTLKNTGRGIAINAFSVMVGFAVLFFSGITILKSFGFLIIFSLILCLLCALVLIPALCYLVKPSFLEKSPIKNFNNINGL
ncbi:MAG TPA: efflux RND transporter permease subunit, partial [Bacteroidales bacterium]|nr:efflux RND transporter permease subunit [Bacteroidales bacterium]